MSNKQPVEEKEPVVMEEMSQDSDASLIQKGTSEMIEDDEGIADVIPKMTVNVPEPAKEVAALISDEHYLNFLQEVVGNIREDRKQLTEYIDNFADMVINDGDATTSSKETLVNLLKAKTDLQDKMLKAADLMTRLKMKNTYAYSGPHLNAMQQNNFISTEAPQEFSRKELIRVINHAKKKKDS